MADKRIRVLVVDDSPFMRSMLKGALAETPNVEVVGSAQNGQEALTKLAELKPDVMTLDIEMPGLNGLQVLERVMKDSPLPVVMVSTKTQEGARMTFEALELGAVDYVAKPLADKKASLQGFRSKVVDAVEAAFQANMARLGAQRGSRILRPRKVASYNDGTVIAIGISAGGPATLHKLIPVFPKEFPPIVITQHMPADFTGPFAKRLSAASSLEVKEAETGDKLQPGLVLLAPGNRHMRIVRRTGSLQISLNDEPKVAGFRPSVNVLFESVASACQSDAIGLVMTGMGFDGAEGIRKLKSAGAETLAQDQESCIVYGMPKAAFQTGCVNKVVSLAVIPDTLAQLLSKPRVSG